MKNRMRKVQVIAFVMSILILLNIPLPALAEAAIENAIEQAQNQPVLMTDKLTETETYWQNADGSITYEQHLEPIRYQDEEGQWHDIVNDVVQVDKSPESEDPFKEEGYDYRSESSKNWVLFKDSMFDEDPIKVQNGDRVVYIRPVRTLPLPTVTPEATLEPSPTPEAAPSLQPTETLQPAPESTTPQPTDELLEDEAEDAVSQGTQRNAQQTTNAFSQEEQEESRLTFHLKEEEPKQQKQRARSNVQDEPAHDPYVYNPELEYQAVEYSNVFGNGMGLYLRPNNSGLKEDIVLQSRPSVDRFSFEIKIDKGVLEKQENNEILWKDVETDEEYGYIPTPYMIDSGTREEYENISTDIEVLLEEKEGEEGTYLYTLVPSAAYLDDENTVYPVRIDPSIQLPRDGYTSDSYISSGEPNRNFATNQYIRVGHDTDNVIFRGMIYHVSPTLTARYIDSANLKLYQSYNGSTQPSIQTYRVHDRYTNANVTWNNQPRVASGYSSVTVGNMGWYTWDLTKMEREWQAGTYSNEGIMLVSNNESSKWYKRFYSFEGTNKPVFTINYRDINRNFTATGRPGAINSSSQFIDVSWTNTSGVSVKVCLDGKEYTPSGSTSHTFSVSSYVSHKVKIKYTTDYGAVYYSEEKTIAPVADRTPPIFNTTSEVSVADGNLNIQFAPALKPASVVQVQFPTWSANGGQDDIKWYSAKNSGNGVWSYTVNLANHNNERGTFWVDCYATTADGIFDYFAGKSIDLSSDVTEWEGKIAKTGTGKEGRAIAATMKITRESPSSNTFTVTITGLSKSGMISKHELFWSELNSDELHPLDTLETTGLGEGVIAKSYDIRDKELPSGTTINVYAKATDKYGNYTVPNLLLGTVDIPNYVTPQAPQLSVYNGDQYYTMGQEPLFPIGDTATIRWNIEKGLGSDFDIGFVQYSFDKQTWTTVSSDNWLDKGEGKTAAVNGTVISTANLPEGISEVYVRGVDNNPVPEQALAGEVSSIKVLKDTKAPVLYMTYPTAIEEIEGVPKWEISDVVSITNIEEARLQSVKVEIGSKSSWLPIENLYFYKTVYEWTEGVHVPIAYPLEIDLTSVAPDGQYQIRITITDKSGNVVTEERKFLLNSTMSYSGPDFYLHADQYEAYEQLIHIQEVPLVLDVSACDYAPDLGHTMFVRVDGKEIDYTYDAEAKEITINPLSEQNQPIFKPGEWLPIVVAIEQPSGDLLSYSCATFSSNEDAADIQHISDMENFEIQDGKLTLTANSGSFVFTSPQMGPAPIGNIKFDYSVLNNMELPNGTKIEFLIELLDQEGNLVGSMGQDFFSGEIVNRMGWNYASTPDAYQYKMHVTVTQPTGQTGSAVIDSLGFTTTYLAAPAYVNTELIAPASNLSAMPLVNYTTWLRWTASPTEGAVYDIYRSELDTFDMETMQPIASNLTTTYYYDHDLVPEKTFNYWIVAKKDYLVEGETVTQYARSQPSPKQTATMVDEAELDKQLGSQDYWSYATVTVGNTNGYINMSSGNLVYQQTDLAMAAPLLASTMRRTYNSQAKSYTALGKGWDFGLNTNLLREYDKTTGEEVGLILKDGDGTIHRFAKQEDGSYKSPAGVFIVLSQREDGKYIAHRSDDIDYLFNASMIIEEFSEPNGNKLLFTYDERGRLVKVMHNVYDTATESEQQYLAFEYGEQPHNQDRIVKVIAHYSGVGETAVEDVYQYTYGSDENDLSTYGMLINVETAGEQTYTYVETNADGTDMASSTTSIKTIEESYTYQDGENNVFTICIPTNISETGVRTYRFDLDMQDRVTKSTDAIGDYSNVVYVTDDAAQTVTATITNYKDGQNIGQGQYITNQALHGTLVKTIQSGNRITELGNYDTDVLKPGTITSYKDAAHTQPLTYTSTYNDNGTASTVTDPEGIRTEYSYYQKPDGTMTDWITSEKTYQGSTLLDRTDYTYDANGNLLSEKIAVKNPSAFTDAESKTTTYTYDARGLRLTQTDWNGKTTTYTYDSYGRLLAMTEAGSGITIAMSYTYDARNNTTSESIARGGKALTTRYTYDGFGRPLEIVNPDGQREISNYNKNGRVVSKIIVGAPASDGGSTQAKCSKYVYDNLDRVVSMTDPEGNVTKTIYGATENATVVTTNIMAREDSELVVRSTVAETAFDGSYSSEKSGTLGEKTYYDYQGNETKTVQLYKDAEGWKETRAMHSETDTQGRVIRQWNEVTRTESGKLAEEDYTEIRTDYDALGNPIRQWTLASKNGDTKQYSVKQYSYDLLGRVLSVRERTGLMPYSNANIGDQASDIVTTYTYDAKQSDGVSMDTQTQAGGKQTNTYYNSLGQVVKEVQTGAGTDATTITKEYQYDAYGRQVKMLEQGAVRYQYSYDDYDRIIKQTTGSASENNVHETQLTYDHFSRRAAMKDIVDNVEILTTWKYDKNDQAIQLLQDGKVVFYAYDEAGDMTAMQYGANGNIRTIQYDLDPMGRLTAIRSGTQTLTEEAEGVVQTNDVKTVKTYGYDAIGDLTSTTEYAEFDTKADVQGLAVTGTFTYDDVGRPLTTVYTQNNEQKEKYTMKYDNKGNVVSETYIDSYADSFTSNKTITTIRGYQYDAVGRMTENTVTKREGDTQTGQKTIGYTYDRIGNRLTETNSQTYDNGSSNATKTYTYDSLDRLIKVTENGKVTTNVGEQSYNQILAEYSYDTYGNQTSQKVYELDIMNANSKLTAEIRHTYDAANQLLETKEKKTGQDWKTVTINRYNGEGQRVRKTEDGMADGDFTRYFYMSGALAFSTNSDPNYISDENILDLNGKVVAARRSFAQLQEGREESQYWTFHYDARGSVTNVVGANNTGALYRVESNVYDAFGQDEKPETPQTQIQNEVKFTGAVQDNSGLYYMGSRHYDPSTGRFIQQDVLQGDPYSPWTQNRYAYCGGNPSSYIDPTGHFLGALFGGLFGGLWGGIKSALNGDGFWKGAASGAAKGFLTGAGIDIALATGGTLAPIGYAMAFGAIGGVAGDVVDQGYDMATGRRKEFDTRRVFRAGLYGAADGLFGYGLGVLGGGRHVVNGTVMERFSSDLGLVQSGKDLAEVVISAAAEETSAVVLEAAPGVGRKPAVTRNRNTGKKTIHASSTKQALEVVNSSNGAIQDSDRVNMGNSCYITVGMIRPGSGQYRHPSTWFSPTNPYRWC